MKLLIILALPLMIFANVENKQTELIEQLDQINKINVIADKAKLKLSSQGDKDANLRRSVTLRNAERGCGAPPKAGVTYHPVGAGGGSIRGQVRGRKPKPKSESESGAFGRFRSG